MLRVWTDRCLAGGVDRHGFGSVFTYEANATENDAISLTMRNRTASWGARARLAPIFDMNLPEGALRRLLTRRFAKTVGSFDDFDLLSVVGSSQIGRLRYSAPDVDLNEDVPFQSVDEVLRARRGDGLLDHLLERFAVHSGISGVQPKVLIRAVNRPGPPDRLRSSARSATHIVKFWSPGGYPELAANEYFCLKVAQRVGLEVPSFHLSDDGAALVLERFDLSPNGGRVGFEDFCVLNALRSSGKYMGSYETRLFKRAAEFTGAGHREALERLYKLFVLNCAIRNGDAHLKNFGVVYQDVTQDPQLAPVYDLITTRAYLPNDGMALTLSGTTRWPDREKLTSLGRTRADLGEKQIEAMLEATADAISDTANDVRAYFADRAQFPEVGLSLLAAWQEGIDQSLGSGRTLVVGSTSVKAMLRR
ncbi:type II toxin-antitoxin system HipA family toxin [Microvirga terricola]|uniref:Type II toxin-antitoxin system HipA family toxin n=1 Tax=Microvirga terricola TaxID=2719797 RepID=A0ABX0VG16_9HYPH|nr:type II toxin-antitoxin system HipA family toxin [Microvirga terricola]NIX77356.1 type II toxin-antitoxin system HipA family toxin [Microvirga terricola]